jgi:hypothetical protein
MSHKFCQLLGCRSRLAKIKLASQKERYLEETTARFPDLFARIALD